MRFLILLLAWLLTISDYAENKLLDAVLNATTTGGGLPTANVYVKLHTGDPGEAGTANAAGETTRKPAAGGSWHDGRRPCLDERREHRDLLAPLALRRGRGGQLPLEWPPHRPQGRQRRGHLHARLRIPDRLARLMSALQIAGLDEVEAVARSLDVEAVIERELAAGIPFGPFHRRWQLERAPEHVQRMLRLGRERPELQMAQSNFDAAEQQLFPPANLRTAIATTTTETNLWDPSLWGLIPALTMKAGFRYKVSFGGVFGTTGTPTIVYTARCGTNNSAPPTGTTLGASPTVTLGTATAQAFYGEFTMGVRSIGVAASGATVTGNGFAVHCGAAAATVSPVIVFGGAIPATIDHTVAQGLAVSIIWGTSNAANTLTPQWVSFESL